MNETKLINIAPGIDVLYLPTEKFHTFKIEANFVAPQKLSETTNRRLIANVLQRSNAAYPTEGLMSKKLASMYGAELSSQATIIQNVNILSFSINSIFNFNNYNVVPEALNFILESLLRPNLNSDRDQFNSDMFSIEKQNLNNVYASIKDDYALKATLEMKKMLYSNNLNLAVPAFGMKSQLKDITAASLCDSYQTIIGDNRLIITAVGKLSEPDLNALLNSFDDFAQNYQGVEFETNDFIDLPNDFIAKDHQEKINQSQIVLAYKFEGIFDRATILVLNYMLGGDDQALLFKNVREKNSLAYSIYSTLNAYQGYLLVQAGVSADKIEFAEKLIDQQIEFLRNQDLNNLMKHAQQALISRHQIMSDNISTHSNRLLIKALNESAIIDEDDYVKRINNVKLANVKKAASALKKIARYRLMGVL